MSVPNKAAELDHSYHSYFRSAIAKTRQSNKEKEKKKKNDTIHTRRGEKKKVARMAGRVSHHEQCRSSLATVGSIRELLNLTGG